MKPITFLFMAAFLFTTLTADCQKVEPGNVVGISQVKPAPGVTDEQFEKFYLEEFFPAFNNAFSSIPISLLKMILGKRMGEYAEFYVFESHDEWYRWFPKPGVSSEEAKQGFKNMGDTWSKFRATVSSLPYTDYEVLPYTGKTIKLHQGAVVGVFECEIALEDGMTFEGLEEFYREEYIPAFMKNFQGAQLIVFKGERGERTGKYTEIIVLKSLAEFNKWVTEDGYLNEKARQAFENMGKTQERMEKMYSYNNTTYYIVL